MIPRESSRVPIIGLIALAVFGCGDGAPRVGGTVPVRGKVTLNGKEVTAGVVQFYPDPPGSSKFAPTGTIQTDGTYELITVHEPGALPGKYVATVNGDASLPTAYKLAQSSPLRLSVVAGAPEGTYDLKLIRP